jgi:hypothetical protein
MKKRTLKLTPAQQRELTFTCSDPYNPDDKDTAREALILDIRKGVVSEENFPQLQYEADYLYDLDGLPIQTRMMGINILRKLTALGEKS